MKDYKEPKMETVELKEEALEEVSGGVFICDKFEDTTNCDNSTGEARKR